MAKKRKTFRKTYRGKPSSAELARRAKIGKKISASLKGKKQSRATKLKLKLYRGLVHDYIDKQKQLGHKISYKEAVQSDDMRGIVRDLKEGARLKTAGNTSAGNNLIINALEKTTRRDGIAHEVPPGESPHVRGEA